MKVKPAWGREALAVLICVVYAFFVLGFWGESLKLSIITNVFMGVWVVLKHLESNREKARADSEKHRADEIGERLIDRVNYQVGKLEIQVNISNYEGDCRTRWIWTGIRKVRPDAPIPYIRGRIGFSPSESAFSAFPQLMPEYDGQCEIRFLKQDPNFCEFQVWVKEITNEISFGYTASIDRAFCMKEELLSGQFLKYEFFGFHVDGAIESLVIKVIFPFQYYPQNIQSEVCVGELIPTEISYSSEKDRINKEGGFKNERGEASLIVKKPKMGHLYFLRWRPLPAIVVEGMRQRESSWK
ncbi:MAG TPA: hypothetical protein VJ302_26590 [Blastocatellia bacterium]|nr:hypothetical protein [Blastocatellia bacterium]